MKAHILSTERNEFTCTRYLLTESLHWTCSDTNGAFGNSYFTAFTDITSRVFYILEAKEIKKEMKPWNSSLLRLYIK